MSVPAAQENLDERIERIRKRDEEIEKKHREAEEDRLMAVKGNAMVKTKASKNDAWPKSHKYDTLDFTYDQKVDEDEEKRTGHRIGSDKDIIAKGARGYKKFADGEGPPPDPTYNFLADAERDGSNTTDKISGGDKNDWRQPGNGAANIGRNKNGLNNSFRGRNGKSRSANGQQRHPRQDPNNEYNSWKNERERIDEARIGRQRIGEGKWRREWDNDKGNDSDIQAGKPSKAAVCNDAIPDIIPQVQKPLPIVGSGRILPPQVVEMLPIDLNQRDNILVSVVKDGEVKSVKRKLNSFVLYN